MRIRAFQRRSLRTRGIEPQFVEWAGAGSPWLFVWDENAVRRHLEEGTKAAIKLLFLRGDAAWQAQQEKRRRRRARRERSRATVARRVEGATKNPPGPMGPKGFQRPRAIAPRTRACPGSHKAGLLGQKEAAKLGPKSPTPDDAKRMHEVAYALETQLGIGQERRVSPASTAGPTASADCGAQEPLRRASHEGVRWAALRRRGRWRLPEGRERGRMSGIAEVGGDGVLVHVVDEPGGEG